MKKRIIAVCLLLAAIPIAVTVWAQVANVRSIWSSGELVFEDAATGTDIMVIKDSTDGVNINLALDCDSTLNVDGASTLVGDVSITGAITKYKVTVEDATTAVTVLAADSGTVFVTGDTSSTFTLPTCASGLVYTFCINSATTHYIDCASGDRIATTDSDGDRISADAVGECVTLVGRGTSGTINWCVASMFGTWSDAN